MFEPLDIAMRRRNDAYYKSGATRIHRDFLTYAQDGGGMLQKAVAASIHSQFCGDEEERQIHILEIGVGEGGMAFGILSALKGLDVQMGTDLSERTSYALADFSAPLLAKAKKRLNDAGFNQVRALEFDASSAIPRQLSDMQFSRIVCNELFSDLPAKMHVLRNGVEKEVCFGQKMEHNLRNATPSPLASALLSKLPEGYFVPENLAAAESCATIAELLSREGAMDVFDYGFYFSGDFAIPPEFWNRSIVREYGTQWTVDLNFIYMSASLASEGFLVEVERQEDFASKMAGHAMLPSSSKNGLTYVPSDGNIRESDSFYHMAVRRNGK